MVREIENKKQLVINQSEEYCLTKGSWSFTWPVSQKKNNFFMVHFKHDSSYCLVAKPCPTFCDPMNCSLPGSFVVGISQVRILEWVAISFSRGSSQPRDQTPVAGGFFTTEPLGSPILSWRLQCDSTLPHVIAPKRLSFWISKIEDQAMQTQSTVNPGSAFNHISFGTTLTTWVITKAQVHYLCSV